ncbi:aminotransferase class IV, partial [bacterium]|nr:aminotransferase class IV [bacterium]
NKWGEINIESEEVEDISGPIKVILSIRSGEENKQFYYHKTTYRPWESDYKQAKQNGYYEVLFINSKSFLLEGAFTNIFIQQKQKIYTPPLNLGLLNGCYRQHLIQNKNVYEKIVTLQDLQTADEVFITNSVRKEIIVDKIYDMNTKLVYEKKK